MLPFIEERILFDEIKFASDGLKVRPFDLAVADAGGGHFSNRQIPAFRCPSYTGGTVVAAGKGSEYDVLAFSGRPAISSYAAIVGTHVDQDGGIQENGIIVSRCATAPRTCDGKGLRLKDIGDGISRTVIICESRELVYSAWFDGQAMWVVGLNGRGVAAPDGDGFPMAEKTLLGQSDYSDVALGQRWPGRVPRAWGPSSEHAAGVVLHAFADAHAQALAADIDPTVYYRLITRNGGEPVVLDEL